MEPQVHEQEQKHPLPLWMRWLIVLFVLLLITGGTILWIIQGAQAIIPIVVFTALGTLLAFFQFLPSLFPLSKHTPSTKPPHSSQVALDNEQPLSVALPNQLSSPDSQIASPPVRATVQTPIPITSMMIEGSHNEKNANQVAGTSPKVDWGEAPHTSQFYGRNKELAQLKQWIMDDRSRMVAVLGVGGIGKTSLAATLVEQIQEEFAYVFWRSLQNAPPLKSILQECIKFISDQQQIDLPEDVEGQLSILVEYLRKRRTLLILDNGESVLQAGDRAGQYRHGYEGYGRLLQRVGETKHQSCLLLTSREKPKEIARLEGNISPVHSLQVPGLEQGAGHQILKDKGLIESHEAYDTLIHSYSGNPLALKLVSASVYELFRGNIVEFLKEREMSTDVQDLLDQQFQRLPQLERDLIYWLAIECEEVSVKDLQEDLVPPVAKRDILNALASLRQRSMIETNSTGYFSLQPVILEHVTLAIIEQMYQEISSETIGIFVSHALAKAQSKEHVRDTQVRLILVPVAERLLASTERAEIEKKLQSMLSILRETQPQHSGYAVANTIHLLLQLQCNLSGYDFSHLAVRQAYLRGVSLSGVSFAHSDIIGSVFTETFGGVLSVTFSPVGHILAAGTASGDVRLWQIPKGMLLRTLQGHIDWVTSVSFSSDGSLLASGSDDQTVRLWDVSTGLCLKMLQGYTHWVRSVAFSPSGEILAGGSEDQTVRLWDPSTGQCLKTLQGHSDWVTSVAFSSDGRLLATGSADQTVRLWDPTTAHCLKILQGHTNQVISVAFSSDGRLLATGSADQTVRLWDPTTAHCLKILQGHTNQVISVAFSSDGQLLATGSADQTVRLWDTTTAHCLKILQGHTNQVISVAFSPGEEILASGSEDQVVRLWDTSTGQCLNILQGYTNWVTSVAFSPDGKILASGSQDQMVRLWNTSTGQCLKTLQGHTDRVLSVAFSPDGKILASGSQDQMVRLWNPSTGQCLNILQGHEGRVWSIAFSPDGKILATGSADSDKTVHLWDPSTGQCLNILQGHEGRVWSIAFSPDGKILATGSDDKTVHLWDPSTGQCLNILQGHEGRVWSIAFSPDGKILATSNDNKTVYLWDLSTGQCLNILQGGHSERVVSVAFSPDGKILASGSQDWTLRLWDPSTGQCLKTLQGHTDQIWSVAFSPDGKILASGSDDGTIKLWDLKTGGCLQTLRNDRPYERMNITDVKGLTVAQKSMLKALGAIEDDEVK